MNVATALLERPAERHFAFELSQSSGVSIGVVYPLLLRLVDAGLLSYGWEQPSADVQRPPLRFYLLTPAGRDLLSALVETAQHQEVTSTAALTAATASCPKCARPQCACGSK